MPDCYELSSAVVLNNETSHFNDSLFGNGAVWIVVSLQKVYEYNFSERYNNELCV